jgi:hypothetical protein
MSTSIRPEVSDKNEYWIDKHRYYELKHFCLQYPLWKKCYNDLDGIGGHLSYFVCSHSNTPISPTEKCAIDRDFYYSRIKMLEKGL